MAQDPQRYRGPDGSIYEALPGGGFRRTPPPSSAPAPQAPAGGGYTVQPMETPADRRAEEDRAYRRERDAVVDTRAERQLAVTEQAAGLRGNPYQKKFDEARATRDATRFDEALTGWNEASGLEFGGQRAERMLEDGAPVGAFADQRIAAGRIAGDWLGWLPGIPTREETNQLEQLRLIGSQGALGDVSQLKGPLSEKELAFIQRLQIDPSATRETNMQVAEAMQWAARRQAAYGESMQNWVMQHGSPSAPNEQGLSFDAWWGRHAAQNLPFPDGSQAPAPAATGGIRPGQSVPPEIAARFGDDGRVTAEEMLAAGWTPDRESGQWLPPGGGAGGPPPPPSGPQGPQGGAPEGGGARGFAAVDNLIDNLPGALRGPAEYLRRGAAFYTAAGEQVPFLDEAGAAIGGALTGNSYEDMRASQAAMRDYDNENYRSERVAGGITGAAAQIPAGGAALGRVAIGRAAAGAPRAERLARFGVRTGQNAGLGAGGAGIYAAGAAEGSAPERLEAGGNALAAGATFGAVAPYAPAAAGRVGRIIDDTLGNAPSRMADAVGGFAGRQAGRVGNALGVPGSQDLVNRSTGNALQPLANRVADRLGPERVNALSPRAATFSDNAVAPTMVDAGDDGFRGMVKAAASRNTPARQQARDFAEGRAEALPTRLSMQARRVVSSDNRPVDDIVQELDEARSAQARTTYAEPYAQPVQIDAETAQALSGAPGRAALTRARSAAEAFNDTAAMQEIDALAAGQTQSVSAGTLDRIRQAMSGRAEKLAQNPATRAVGAGVAQRAGTVDTALDNVEGLAPARDAYRQASRQIEATQMGGRFLNANPDDFQGAMQGLSPEQLQPARAAMARNIEISARNPGSAPGVARRLYSDPELGNMGRAAMGEDMDRLSAAARAEYSAVRNASEVNPRSGSQTSLNDQDAGGLAGVGQDAMTIMRRPLSGPLSVIANRFTSRGFNDAEAQQLVEMAIDPNRTNEMIELMAQRMTRRAARNLARSTRYQVLATTQSGQQSPE